MNDEQDRRSELPDNLGEIVARIVAEPAPDDLKDQIRSRLGDRFKPRPRASRYVAIAVATFMVAATIAAVVFVLPSSESRTVSPVRTGPAVAQDQNPTGERVVVFPVDDHLPIRRPSVAGPSLWAYHRAANDSLDRLDVLLVEHAGMVLTSGSRNHSLHSSLQTSRTLEEL